MNPYAYVANDPINATDPTGMFGRGEGWTDDEWEQFDAAQQEAATDMFSASAALKLTAIDMQDGDISDVSQAVIGELEKVMGEGSGTIENMNALASTLSDSAQQLRSDAIPANQLSQSAYANDLSPMRVVVATRGGVPTRAKSLEVNAGHSARFGRSEIGHEGVHAARPPFGHGQVGGVDAYSHGTPQQRKAYRNLPFPDTMRNPDHLMGLVYK